jgi:hypothetical protein
VLLTARGLKLQILNATTVAEINAAFAGFARERPDALFLAGDGFFSDRRMQFATLTARDRIPATGSESQFVKAGLLMSYGTGYPETFVKSATMPAGSSRREGGRTAGAAIDQIRVRPEPADRASARHRGAAGRAFHRRRGESACSWVCSASLPVERLFPPASRRSGASQTVLFTPQKNGSGPCATPVTSLRQACCWRYSPSGA